MIFIFRDLSGKLQSCGNERLGLGFAERKGEKEEKWRYYYVYFILKKKKKLKLIKLVA